MTAETISSTVFQPTSVEHSVCFFSKFLAYLMQTGRKFVILLELTDTEGVTPVSGFVLVQSSSVVDLTEENYHKVLKTRFVFINFYKPWYAVLIS